MIFFAILKWRLCWTQDGPRPHPKRGSACIVIVVVCEEMTVFDATETNLPPARAEAMKAAQFISARRALYARGALARDARLMNEKAQAAKARPGRKQIHGAQRYRLSLCLVRKVIDFLEPRLQSSISAARAFSPA